MNHVLVLGHSIAAGANSERPGYGWAHILGERDGITVYNEAIAGSTVNGWVEEHLHIVRCKHHSIPFSHVAIHALGNDVMLALDDGRVTWPEFLDILRDLWRVLARIERTWPDAKRIVVGEFDPFDGFSSVLVVMPAWKQYAKVSEYTRFLDWLLTLMCRDERAYVDLHAAFMGHGLGRLIGAASKSPPYLALRDSAHPSLDDILHPVTAGHAAIAEAVGKIVGEE